MTALIPNNVQAKSQSSVDSGTMLNAELGTAHNLVHGSRVPPVKEIARGSILPFRTGQYITSFYKIFCSRVPQHPLQTHLLILTFE